MGVRLHQPLSTHLVTEYQNHSCCDIWPEWEVGFYCGGLITIISFIIAIRFWYFKHKWKTAESIVSLKVSLMTQYVNCSLTPWSFPFVTISHSVTGKAFSELLLEQPTDRNFPSLKTVHCWILQFSWESIWLTLMSEFAFSYAFGGVVLLKWTYMKCYVIIWVQHSFVSITNFIERQ